MDGLKGIGHFSFWFVAGYFIFKTLFLFERDRFWSELYGPFIPFALGIIAAIPYLLATLGVVSFDQIMGGFYNLFLLYGVINQIGPVVLIFSNFHLSLVLDSIVYLLLVLHYIRLVKTTRQVYAK